VNTPLTTNLESRQIFAVDHPLQGYLYYRDRAGHEQQEARAVSSFYNLSIELQRKSPRLYLVLAPTPS
jgi:hypothetical protein